MIFLWGFAQYFHKIEHFPPGDLFYCRLLLYISLVPLG